MRRILSVFLLSILILLISLPGLAAAWEVKGGNETITKDRTVEGDLIFSGQRLEIDGVVKGDLMVMAREVVINGSVEGSVIGLVWEKLTINGVVQASLRVLANEITLNGSVNRNLLVLAARFFAERSSRVGAGILSLGSDISLAGRVDGPVEIRTLNSGTISGRFGDKLVLYGIPPDWKAPATVSGKVIDYSQNGKDPSKIKGIKINEYTKDQEVINQNLFKTLFWVSFIWFLGNLLMSLIFYSFFPRTAWEISDPTPLSFRKNLVAGLIGLFLIPVIMMLLCLTVVGIPLAVLIGLFYLVLLFFSGVPLNLWFGRLLFKSRFKAIWLIILGSITLLGIGMVPLLGIVANLIFSFTGVGMIVRMVKPQFLEAKAIDLKA